MITLSTGLNIAYLTFYGVLCLTSLVLIVEWGRLAFKRAKFLEHDFHALYHDRYMVIATALTLNSTSMAGLSGTRVYNILVLDDYAMPNAPLLTAFLVGTMLTLTISKFGLVWATHLTKWDLAWIVTLVSTVAWAGFSFWWVLS